MDILENAIQDKTYFGGKQSFQNQGRLAFGVVGAGYWVNLYDKNVWGFVPGCVTTCYREPWPSGNTLAW